jgi:hypothetical protein
MDIERAWAWLQRDRERFGIFLRLPRLKPRERLYSRLLFGEWCKRLEQRRRLVQRSLPIGTYPFLAFVLSLIFRRDLPDDRAGLVVLAVNG